MGFNDDACGLSSLSMCTCSPGIMPCAHIITMSIHCTLCVCSVHWSLFAHHHWHVTHPLVYATLPTCVCGRSCVCVCVCVSIVHIAHHTLSTHALPQSHITLSVCSPLECNGDVLCGALQGITQNGDCPIDE